MLYTPLPMPNLQPSNVKKKSAVSRQMVFVPFEVKMTLKILPGRRMNAKEQLDSPAGMASC
jgi:hypothetical protein